MKFDDANGRKHNNQQGNKTRSIFSLRNETQSVVNDEHTPSSLEYLQKMRLQALYSCLLMIDRAAEVGQNLENADIEAVLNMADALDLAGKGTSENHLTVELEAKFWTARSHISNLLKPATALAIQERSDFLLSNSEKQRKSFTSTIRRYARGVLCVLVITGIVHAYYFSLDAAIARAKESISQFDAARTAAFTAIASNKQSSPQVESDISVNIHNMCAALYNWRSTAETIAGWVTNATVAQSIEGRINSMPYHKTDKADENIGPGEELCDPNHSYDIGGVANDLNKIIVNDPSTQDALSEGERVRNLIGRFILPALYGALGALAYVVRSLSLSIKEITYSRVFRFEHQLHLPLGILAGATIGLVISPDILNTVFGLSMLGLAFALGYSVDVFFILLDNFIKRLKPQDDTRSRP